VPIVLFQAYLPELVQKAAEATVGFLIVVLAVWLLVRWRRGVFRVHVHVHDHDGSRHVHLHSHSTGRHHVHRHSIRTRSPLGAYGIRVVHGMAGSAGVGVLLLASVRDQVLAVTALALFAPFTAVSIRSSRKASASCSRAPGRAPPSSGLPWRSARRVSSVAAGTRSARFNSRRLIRDSANRQYASFCCD